ncbi:MAG: Gfo/Idh/MocA family oxidoreductase [bacterium]
MNQKFSRREFLKIGGAATAGMTLDLATMAQASDQFSSNDTLQIGVIGTGDRGAWEVYILKQTPGTKVVACCDILPKHLQNGLEHAAKNSKGYSDYRELLEDPNVEAVLIATPQHLHYQMALDCLAAGKDIICQKTMTLNLREALELSTAVKNSKSVFQVAYQWQSSPLFREVRRMIKDDRCGRITHVRCNYNRNGDWRVKVDDPQHERLLNWRMYREYSGGLMAELCSHQINIVNWVLGSLPLKVTGFGGIDYWKDGRETYDNVHAIFEYPGGIKASFQAITTNAFEDVSLVFMGTEGTLEIKKEEGQVAHFYSERKKVEETLSKEEIGNLDAITSATRRAWARGDAIPIIVADHTKDDLETTRAMFLEFAECVRKRTQPTSNVDNGRAVSIAVDMANLAMQNNTIEYWKPEYGS